MPTPEREAVKVFAEQDANKTASDNTTSGNVNIFTN
jgi:hypothetical protein